MRVLQINTLSRHGSTGKICSSIQTLSEQYGIETYVACRYLEKGERPNREMEISTWFDNHFHNRMSKWFLLQGQCSSLRTRAFIRKIKKLRPDIVHLHHLHGNYVNIPMLFRYLAESGTKVVWTMHDCWAFTGWCPHFTASGCMKWKDECKNCPLYEKNSKQKKVAKLFEQKKELFLALKDLTIVTPSKWLMGVTKQSFFRDTPIRVIHNGIDLSVFRRTESDFKEKLGIQGKHIVLGVAFEWNEKKGIDVFLKLAEILPQDYVIVLVGHMADIPVSDRIITVPKTSNQNELAGIYSAADVFLNPTREDTYPTVNMEAIACGTPVVTFSVGGSPEILDEDTGIVVEKNDINATLDAILKICGQQTISSEKCMAAAEKFDGNATFQEYIRLYQEIGGTE